MSDGGNSSQRLVLGWGGGGGGGGAEGGRWSVRTERSIMSCCGCLSAAVRKHRPGRGGGACHQWTQQLSDLHPGPHASLQVTARTAVLSAT